jgi:hypothetical protein
MSIQIKTIQSADAPAWDEYVHNHPKANLYHLSGWKNVINKTYGHKTYYLMATRKPEGSQLSVKNYELNSNHVVGIFPLVHLKHFLFGNSLISIPFFDLGGILADDQETVRNWLTRIEVRR